LAVETARTKPEQSPHPALTPSRRCCSSHSSPATISVRLPAGARFGVGMRLPSSTRRFAIGGTSRPPADRRSSSSACSKRASGLTREGFGFRRCGASTPSLV